MTYKTPESAPPGAMFRQAAQFLQTALLQWGWVIGPPELQACATPGERARERLSAESNTRAVVTRKVDQWLAEHQKPEMPPGEAYWFWLRLDAAHRCLDLVAQDEQPGLFALARKTTHEQLLRWMLVDWWERCGLVYAVNSWMDEEGDPRLTCN